MAEFFTFDKRASSYFDSVSHISSISRLTHSTHHTTYCSIMIDIYFGNDGSWQAGTANNINRIDGNLCMLLDSSLGKSQLLITELSDSYYLNEKRYKQFKVNSQEGMFVMIPNDDVEEAQTTPSIVFVRKSDEAVSPSKKPKAKRKRPSSTKGKGKSKKAKHVKSPSKPAMPTSPSPSTLKNANNGSTYRIKVGSRTMLLTCVGHDDFLVMHDRGSHPMPCEVDLSQTPPTIEIIDLLNTEWDKVKTVTFDVVDVLPKQPHPVSYALNSMNSFMTQAGDEAKACPRPTPTTNATVDHSNLQVHEVKAVKVPGERAFSKDLSALSRLQILEPKRVVLYVGAKGKKAILLGGGLPIGCRFKGEHLVVKDLTVDDNTPPSYTLKTKRIKCLPSSIVMDSIKPCTHKDVLTFREVSHDMLGNDPFCDDDSDDEDDMDTDADSDSEDIESSGDESDADESDEDDDE